MTSKGISKLRKKYSHVNSMDPRQLKVFEGELISYRNLQLEAVGRTGKEHSINEITPTLKEAQGMLDYVQEQLRKNK